MKLHLQDRAKLYRSRTSESKYVMFKDPALADKRIFFGDGQRFREAMIIDRQQQTLGTALTYIDPSNTDRLGRMLWMWNSLKDENESEFYDQVHDHFPNTTIEVEPLPDQFPYPLQDEVHERFVGTWAELLYGNGRCQMFWNHADTAFREVHVRGLHGNDTFNVCTFEYVLPEGVREHTVERSGNEVIVDGTRFVRASLDRSRQVPFRRLPTIRKPTFLFWHPEGYYIYVSTEKYNYYYTSFRLYISGDEARMQEIPVRYVRCLEDYGTTTITTDTLKLYSPSLVGPRAQEVPTWGDTPLSRLDLDQYEIIETDDGCTIKP